MSEENVDPHPTVLPGSNTLVLNKLYSPIRVITAKRAFCLLTKDIAEVIHSEKDELHAYRFGAWIELSISRKGASQDHDEFVRTPRIPIMVPRIIRLLTYDKVPRREVKFNRRNILARDQNRCQYCGKRLASFALSIDHVVPKSRNGKSVWTNVVAACASCNARKGGRLASQAGMRLLREPGIPRRNPLLYEQLRDPRYHLWHTFLPNEAQASH